MEMDALTDALLAEPSTERAAPLVDLDRFVYDRAPLFVYWEATRACDLACQHCRADAIARRHPLELTTTEAQRLFDDIGTFAEDGGRTPHIVVTGGDPLHRPDLFELIAYGRDNGLTFSVTPAGTARLNESHVRRFRDLGVSSVALSLDGSNPERHDAFRGVDGSFQWTIDGARMVVEQGLPLQINTMVTATTLDDLSNIAQLVYELDVTRWALFFLIATGRGRQLREITPAESERFLNGLVDLVDDSDVWFAIKTTEAHHFRRIYHQRQRARGLSDGEILETPVGRGYGVRDGNGVVFVSHTGEVYPSGFLPVNAGNVRTASLVDLYRHGDIFQAVRDVDRLKGKCGVCPFRALCGGSRARAYAATGDPLAADPLCPYRPPAWGANGATVGPTASHDASSEGELR